MRNKDRDLYPKEPLTEFEKAVIESPAQLPPAQPDTQMKQWWGRLLLQRALYALLTFALTAALVSMTTPDGEEISFASAPYLWASIIGALLLLSGQYSASWRYGSHHNEPKDTPSVWRPFAVGLLSEVPAFVLAVGALAAGPKVVRGVEILSEFEQWARYYNCPFTWTFFPLGETSGWRYFIPIVLVLGAILLGYQMGRHNRRLVPKITLKNGK